MVSRVRTLRSVEAIVLMKMIMGIIIHGLPTIKCMIATRDFAINQCICLVENLFAHRLARLVVSIVVWLNSLRPNPSLLAHST